MNLFGWLIRADQRILDSLHSLHAKAGQIMSDLEVLTAAVAKLQADVTTLTNAVSAVDLTAVIASVNEIDAAVTAAIPVVAAPVPA